MKSGNLKFLEPPGPLQACNGTALPSLSHERNVVMSFVIQNFDVLYFAALTSAYFCTCEQELTVADRLFHFERAVNFLNGCAVSAVLFREVNWTSGGQASLRYLETRHSAVFLWRGSLPRESLEQFTQTDRQTDRQTDTHTHTHTHTHRHTQTTKREEDELENMRCWETRPSRRIGGRKGP